MFGRLFGRKKTKQAPVASTRTRYKMKQRMLSFGDDYYIENEQGDRVYKVDGKLLRLRDTLTFRDADGKELCKIQERWLRVKDSMEIEDPDGKRMAMVKQALITPIRQRFTISIEGGPDLDADGNIVDHEYEIKQDGFTVGLVSKKWFRVRDTYGVELDARLNPVVILAAAACIDQLVHD